MLIDLWLYGPLAAYASEGKQRGHANLRLELPDDARMAEVFSLLGIPREEKGITFVNGQLTGLAGLSVDLDHPLRDGDRVAIFHKQSMWPFQYRFGASTSPELERALNEIDGGALHHTPSSVKKD